MKPFFLKKAILFFVSLYGLASSFFNSITDGYLSFGGSGNSIKVSFVFELSASDTYQSHQAWLSLSHDLSWFLIDSRVFGLFFFFNHLKIT